MRRSRWESWEGTVQSLDCWVRGSPRTCHNLLTEFAIVMEVCAACLLLVASTAFLPSRPSCRLPEKAR